MFTPVATGTGELEQSSTGRKPARQKKSKPAAARNSSLEATAHAADQMGTDIGESTQTLAQPGPRNLITELQEHAAIAESTRPVEPEAMDTGESGASRQQNEQQQGQQQGHQLEQQLAPEYRA